MYKKFKQFIYRRLIPLIRIQKYIQWLNYLKSHDSVYLVLGAGPTIYDSWFSTDIATLDVTQEKDFKKYFKNKKINKVLAEHVIEHLSSEQIIIMNKNIYKYSEPDLNIRIAVPDGFHPDIEYINKVKPGGSGEGADDHKHLFDYKTLTEIFNETGYEAKLVEYWDENGKFHSSYDDDNGFIKRCLSNDLRNKDGNPRYTSLIIDFTKKEN